jgi:SAM-dependent methyltransferase
LKERILSGLTEWNREWLNQRFSRDASGGYLAHQPIWGYRRGPTEPRHLVRFARTLNILRTLAGLEFTSFLDVGGGEGYMSALVRDLFGARVITSDLSREAALRAAELFGVRSCTVNAARLPFRDNAFDVVHCSEVLEHLERPFVSLAEMLRVARKYVVVSTVASTHSALKRRCMLKTRDPAAHHFDRNIWMAGDFRAVFGENCAVRPQFFAGRLEDVVDAEAARIDLMEAAEVHKVGHYTVGLIAVAAKDGHPVPAPSRACDQLACDLLFQGPAHEVYERQVWEPCDIEKLSVRTGVVGEATQDLLLDSDQEDEECFPDNWAVNSLIGQYSESNIASGVWRGFYTLLMRALP